MYNKCNESIRIEVFKIVIYKFNSLIKNLKNNTERFKYKGVVEVRQTQEVDLWGCSTEDCINFEVSVLRNVRKPRASVSPTVFDEFCF